MLQQKVPTKPKTKHNSYKSNKPCFSFNSLKGCPLKNNTCKYSHICKICKSPYHIRQNCPQEIIGNKIKNQDVFNNKFFPSSFGIVSFEDKKYCLSYQNKGKCKDSNKGMTCYLRHFCYICYGAHPGYKCQRLIKENKLIHICQKFNEKLSARNQKFIDQHSCSHNEKSCLFLHVCLFCQKPHPKFLCPKLVPNRQLPSIENNTGWSWVDVRFLIRSYF